MVTILTWSGSGKREHPTPSHGRHEGSDIYPFVCFCVKKNTGDAKAMADPSAIDPRAFLFDRTAPAAAPPTPSPPRAPTWDGAGLTTGLAASPTKAVAKSSLGWEQLSQNKYALAGGCSLAALIALVIWTPSFAMTDDKVNFQTVLILAALAFVAVAWGPQIVSALKSMRGSPA